MDVVTYPMTTEQTEIFLEGEPQALVALRMQIAQALREAGDPSHCDVLTDDGHVAFTLDIH